MPTSHLNLLTSYKLATLHEGKIWYISYAVLDPTTSKLKEKRIKFNKIKSKTERRKEARKVIFELNKKLSQGWNPLLEQEAPKGFTRLKNALETFLTAKNKELRPDSMRTYRSICNKIIDWSIFENQNDLYLINFRRPQAIEFLNYIERKGVNATTYNNHVNQCRLIFNWLKENLYTNNNPFEGVTPKKQQGKNRIIIPETIRIEIYKTLVEENPEFLAICLLVFGSLIRPKEISYLKKEDFNFNSQTIRVNPTVSKNHKLRIATIPNNNIEILKPLIERAEFGSFVFGTDNLKPTKNRQCSRYYAKLWDKLVRKPLNLGMEMKLYSLRDSGIVQLLSNGVSPHEVMRLADHKDLTTTTSYLPYANPTGSEIIKQKSSGF